MLMGYKSVKKFRPVHSLTLALYPFCSLALIGYVCVRSSAAHIISDDVIVNQ